MADQAPTTTKTSAGGYAWRMVLCAFLANLPVQMGLISAATFNAHSLNPGAPGVSQADLPVFMTVVGLVIGAYWAWKRGRKPS